MGIFPLIVILTGAIVSAQDLQCYVCNDCAKGYEDTAQVCITETTTTAFETTTGEPTTDETTTDVTATDVFTTDELTTTVTTDEPTTNEDITTVSYSTDYYTETVTESDTTTNDDATTIESGEIIDESYNVQMLDDDSSNVHGYAFVRRRREAVDPQTPRVRCVVTAHQVENRTVVTRGCSFLQNEDSNEAHCRELIAGNYTGVLSRCRVCEDDKCNSAAKTIASFTLLVAVVSALL
ncbi:uncharacterized protein LOC126966012 isoform X2 [Leptidea sinapis]|uniref:uncharacterized protein LOC126966012 isoform X2 n=1 Tax=Leptidea sinapis TaxID=189913 RepID=UPI002141386E|nr:uncharacterized protein LOC126966012 isoform X2 [Leptidea sinapis]